MIAGGVGPRAEGLTSSAPQTAARPGESGVATRRSTGGGHGGAGASTGAGPVPFEREACGGKHTGTLLRGARRLEWLPVLDSVEPARVVDHTCNRCRPISYELLNLGGAFLIRRTERKPVREVVHETARVPKRLALAWWDALRVGAAE